MRKQSSSNAINEKEINDNCGMAYTLGVIGGRWKPNILWRLMKGRLRYSDLKKSIPGVSERMLVAQLRELEKDRVVKRIVYPEVPPRVEYELTSLGLSMRPMLQSISDWGKLHKDKAGELMENLPLTSEVNA